MGSAMNRLELGSGVNPDPKYNLHLDIDPTVNPDIVSDARSIPLGDNSIEAIKAVDVLEHISYRDTLDTLKEWNRVLKRRGELYVQVPEAGIAINRFVNSQLNSVDGLDDIDIVKLAWVLLGGHYDNCYVKEKENWRFNAHYALFTQDSLKFYLKQAGFRVTKMIVNDHPNILCWARKI